MKENELRLNNLVMVNYKTDLLSKVTWIQEGSINVVFDRQPDLLNGVICSVNDLIPIELSEEWLLKFGFKLNMDNFNWNAAIGENEIGDFKLALRHNERIGWFFQSKCTIIKYVHQLQNIFFCLTGEELVFSTEP